MRSAALVLALLTAAPAIAAGDEPAPGAAPSAELRIVRRSKAMFGTVAEALAAARTEADARQVAAHLEAAFAEMARVEALFDESVAQSAVARVNAAAGQGAVVVDPETFLVLDEIQRVAKVSRGAFDPTAAVYGDLWRFDGDKDAAADGGPADAAFAPPSKEQIAERRALVGYQDLVLDGAARTAQLKRAGSRISVAAFVKAYALDRASSVLEGRGVTDFLVTAGGDLVVRGKKGDKPWMVGIQDPRAPGHFAALTASAGAVTTCGDYERYAFEGGARFHDVIDPRTGLPATKVRSVTVTSADALSAEALAHAAFVLGPKDGFAFVERLKGVDAVFVTSDNRVLVTKGLRGAVQYRPPTDAP